mmetsp:Transcript_18140/g.49769  ORF Transcript_18140/g.49769 Transcript_18140/m.49769 type:complete len:239 (-) Transcript_18140:287-1003(-)
MQVAWAHACRGTVFSNAGANAVANSGCANVAAATALHASCTTAGHWLPCERRAIAMERVRPNVDSLPRPVETRARRKGGAHQIVGWDLGLEHHQLACLLDSLLLDGAYAQEESGECHQADDSEDERKVVEIVRSLELARGDDWRGANAHDVEDVPNSGAAEGEELHGPKHVIAKVKLVSAENTQEDGQQKCHELRLPLRAALGVGPIGITLAEAQLVVGKAAVDVVEPLLALTLAAAS